jgi:hypothetical protein
MPRRFAAIFALFACFALAACGGGGGGSSAPSAPQPLTGWAALRAAAAPQVALPGEFAQPQVQPIALDGWEDGIWISRDGLHLFCIYAPADLLSLIMHDPNQLHSADYLRGPTFGMDLTTNPAGRTTWLHGDILHATRASTAQPFSAWQLSGMARATFSEGAPVAIDPGAGWGMFVYTSNEVDPYEAQIYLKRNATSDPSSFGTLLPTVNTVGLTSDNPHLERIDASNLVLFFDSPDRGGPGALDLYYATSADDGTTWTAPALVTSVNGTSDDEQPHLFKDAGGVWWLYFTATNPDDGKLGIYRAQRTGATWDSWGARVLVVGAGNTAGVGEPTLTTAGDLSFVVILEDAHGTATNRFDGDPWIALRVPSAVGWRNGVRQAVGLIAAGR